MMQVVQITGSVEKGVLGQPWMEGDRKKHVIRADRGSSSMQRSLFHDSEEGLEGHWGEIRTSGVMEDSEVIIIVQRGHIGTEGPCQERLAISGQVGC